MAPTRQRLQLRHQPNRGRICQLLVSLGLPRKQVYKQWANHGKSCRQRGSFWQREEHNLELWLERAHTAYRSRMINLHPDRGGSVRDAATLNCIWKQVKHLFEKHGVKL